MMARRERLALPVRLGPLSAHKAPPDRRVQLGRRAMPEMLAQPVLPPVRLATRVQRVPPAAGRRDLQADQRARRVIQARPVM